MLEEVGQVTRVCELTVPAQAVQRHMPPHPVIKHGTLENWGNIARRLLIDLEKP